MINTEENGMDYDCKCCKNYNTCGEDFGLDIWGVETSNQEDTGKVGRDEDARWGFDLSGSENVNKDEKAKSNDDFGRTLLDIF